MSVETMSWVLFNIFIIMLLSIDLGVFNRKSHQISVKEALCWSFIWIALGLTFNLFIYFWKGQQPALEFLTGYVLEKSLSVDNIFVFILIFTYFQVNPNYQHKVLFWGVFGALVLRAVFILTGIALIHKFEWIIYIFGVFLIITGVKLAFEKDKKIDPSRNPVLRLFRKLFPISNSDHDGKFFVRESGTLMATPLLIVLIVIETTDVVFAVDSIPAVLAVTQDPFIVYTSNVFAILGLRALYFALAGIMMLFQYLHYGLALILVFVGAKMTISHFYKIPIGYALAFIGLVLLVSVLASLISRKIKPISIRM